MIIATKALWGASRKTYLCVVKNNYDYDDNDYNDNNSNDLNHNSNYKNNDNNNNKIITIMTKITIIIIIIKDDNVDTNNIKNYFPNQSLKICVWHVRTTHRSRLGQ